MKGFNDKEGKENKIEYSLKNSITCYSYFIIIRNTWFYFNSKAFSS